MPGEMKEELRHILTSGENSDITLTSLDNKTFNVHKFILALRSSFFKNLFTISTSTSTTSTIQLPYNSPAIQLILEYIYIDSLPDTSKCKSSNFSSLLEMFIAADYLELGYGDAIAKNIHAAFLKRYECAEEEFVEIVKKTVPASGGMFGSTNTSTIPSFGARSSGGFSSASPASTTSFSSGGFDFASSPANTTASYNSSTGMFGVANQGDYSSQTGVPAFGFGATTSTVSSTTVHNPPTPAKSSTASARKLIEIQKCLGEYNSHEAVLRNGNLSEIMVMSDMLYIHRIFRYGVLNLGVGKEFSVDMRKVSKETLFRVIGLPVSKFKSSRKTVSGGIKPFGSSEVEMPPYETVFKFLVQWLITNKNFLPMKETGELVVTEGNESAVGREVAEYALANLKFEEMKCDFIRKEVDCGFFSELQMLAVYRMAH
ncbi:hypothetical protein HK098_000137 [Nowakowskiella sp. JEL0407]|nr:hypothetical protein HK098_000137 [Nowakowskiella sp. JEL0407]